MLTECGFYCRMQFRTTASCQRPWLRARFFIHNSGIWMVGTECIRNILFILPLGAEWMEWRTVPSRIWVQNKRMRAFHILAILIPELWTKNALLMFLALTYKYQHCTSSNKRHPRINSAPDSKGINKCRPWINAVPCKFKVWKAQQKICNIEFIWFLTCLQVQQVVFLKL